MAAPVSYTLWFPAWAELGWCVLMVSVFHRSLLVEAWSLNVTVSFICNTFLNADSRPFFFSSLCGHLLSMKDEPLLASLFLWFGLNWLISDWLIDGNGVYMFMSPRGHSSLLLMLEQHEITNKVVTVIASTYCVCSSGEGSGRLSAAA